MKKHASFLLTLSTGIAAWSLCACLLALTTGIIACGLLSGAFTPAPSTLPTTATVPVTNSQLYVSFKQPNGWTLIYSGILRHIPNPVQYATYGFKGHPDIPTFTITRVDFGGLSQDDIVRSEARAIQAERAHIVEELRETMDGLPAGGVRYIREREVGFELMVSQRGRTHTFRWTSDVKYLDELEQIYRAMLPTIRFEPPPP